jgi:hypothetical protein
MTFTVQLSTWLIRLAFRRPVIPSLFPLFIYIATLALTVAVYNHFASIGTPRKDAKGVVIRSGDDLGASGLIEWGWDL